MGSLGTTRLQIQRARLHLKEAAAGGRADARLVDAAAAATRGASCSARTVEPRVPLLDEIDQQLVPRVHGAR